MSSKTTSVRKLFAKSRQSGPATVYTFNDDGTIAEVRTRPARSPFERGTLTREESLCLLMQTGEWPETLAAEADCGMQPNDYGDFGPRFAPQHPVAFETRMIPGAYVTGLTSS